MSKVPSLSYRKVINALQRDGFVVENIKRPTLAKIIKSAELTVEEFLKLV